MDEKTLQALEVLAAKLGTTAQFLWDILLKQAYIDAAMSLVTVVALVVGNIYLFRFVKKMPCQYGEKDIEWFLFGGVCVFSSLLIMVLSFNIFTVIFNPEYWALSKILKLL